MTALSLKSGSILRLTDPYGTQSSYYVRDRKRSGYMLEPFAGDYEGELRYFGDEALHRYYFEGRWDYQPVDAARLTEKRIERLRIAWEAHPKHQRRIAERREIVVRAVLDAIKDGEKIGYAMTRIAAQTIEAHRPKWLEEDRVTEEAAFEKRKQSGAKIAAGEGPREPKALKVPVKRTIWAWCDAYIKGGRTTAALVPDHDLKGPKKSTLDKEVEAELEAEIKRLIDSRLVGRVIRPYWLSFKARLEAKGLAAPCEKTFVTRLRKTANRYETLLATKGKNVAQRSTRVAKHVEEPNWPLQQVEIDHSLADIHLIDDFTGEIVRRCWITMVIDRLTKAILGCHVSFLPPSWATLSRALVHSIWVKDLSDYPHLQSAGGWNWHGVPDYAYTDRGLDFISKSAHASARSTGFELAALPGFSPWLKGSIERCFLKLKMTAYNYEDGVTFINNPDYKAITGATVRVSQFKSDLLEWIVRYNDTPHDSLPGRKTPNEMGRENMVYLGGLPPLREVGDLRRFMGERAQLKISNRGISINGLKYYHPIIDDLLKESNIAGRKFDVCYDPYNLSAIDVNFGSQWVVAHCTRPDIANGVTAWQHEFHKDLAFEMSGGNAITEDMVARATELARADLEILKASFGKSNLRTSGGRLARYLDVGQFFTPIKLIPQPSLDKPLLILGASQTEPGRYVVPHTPGAERAPGLSAAPPVKKSKPRKKAAVNSNASSATSAAAPASRSTVDVQDAMRARIEEARRMRGLQ